MPPGEDSWRRRPSFWLLVASATVLFSVEPGLSLVLLSLGLSGVTLFWIAMLVRLLLLDAFGVLREDVQCPLLRRDGHAGDCRHDR